MMALYTSTTFAKDQIAILYYSIVLTVITVTVAMVIGFIQLLTLVRIAGSPHSLSWTSHTPSNKAVLIPVTS